MKYNFSRLPNTFFFCFTFFLILYLPPFPVLTSRHWAWEFGYLPKGLNIHVYGISSGYTEAFDQVYGVHV